MNKTEFDALEGHTLDLVSEATRAGALPMIQPLDEAHRVLMTLKPLPVDGTVRVQTIDLRRLISFLFQYIGSDRYERYEHDKLLQAASGILTIFATDEKAGGVARLLAHPRYKVYAVQTGPRVVESAADIIERGTVIMDFLPTGKEAVLPTPTNQAGTNYGSRNPFTVPDAWPDWIYAATIVPCNLDGTPATTTESHPVCHLWLNKTKQAGACPWMYLETDSYDWTHVGNFAGDGAADGRAFHTWQVLPRALGVTLPRPLPVRSYAPFADLRTLRDIHLEQIVPHVSGNGCRPTFPADGRTTTEQAQGYFPHDRRRKSPPFPFLYGPRNVATCYMPTWVRVGHNNGAYVGTPWNFAHYLNDPDRTCIPLLGRFHRKAPSSTELGTQLPTPHDEWFGDWSAVPVAERTMWRVEGMCFNEDDIKRGRETNAHINGDPVHDGRVRIYWVNGNGALYEGSARGDDPNRGTMQAEPYVVRMLTPPGTFLDGWGPAYYKGVIYIPDRGKHRIVMRGLEGEDLGIWDEGGDHAFNLVRFEDEGVKPGVPAYFRALRRSSLSTLVDMRMPRVIAPECLRIIEDAAGVPYLFWGALANAEVRRRRLDKLSPYSVYSRPPISAAGKSHFVYFDLDAEAFRSGIGTFGPAGSIIQTTFSDAEQGFPVFLYPSAAVQSDGVVVECTKRYRFADFSDSTFCPSGGYNTASGRGGCYIRNVYGMAFGIGFGNIIGGSSEEVLLRFSLAKPDDPLPDYKMLDRGGTKYQKAGLRDYWGIFGYSKFDDRTLPLPEPYASDADIKGFLAWHAQA